MGKKSRYTRRAKWPTAQSSSIGGRGGLNWLLVLVAIVVGAGGGYFAFDVFMPGPPSQPAGVVEAASLDEPLIGQASVVDGDTLEVHGTRIRLHGIDAPESGQLCSVQEKKTRCGQQAALALSDKIGSAAVRCEPRDVDRYNRVVAVCHAQGEDLNGWMVERGWALAYRHYSADYIPQEKAAEAAGRGIWQGDFVAPWDWRRGTRLQAESPPPEEPADCRIKGNISRRDGERIYHVPGGQYYARTRIDPAKGERWFCTEAEARAAGWRRSRR